MAGLEWFAAGVDPEVVLAALVRSLPDAVSGRLALLGCRVTRVRPAADGDGWDAAYALTVRENSTGQEHTVPTVGHLGVPGSRPDGVGSALPLGAAGWSWALPELGLRLESVAEDESLPGLAALTDEDLARSVLGRCLAAAGLLEAGSAVAGCVVSVVSHKPGVRATLVCDLDYPAGAPAGPPAVVAKVHSDDEGLRAHQAARALLAAGFGTPPARLADPIAYVPELRLSVQEHVSSYASYKDLFHTAFDDGSAAAPAWEALVTATRTTASALARLHRTPVTLPASADWEDELSSVRAKHDKLARVTELPPGTSAALVRLELAARRTPADPPAPCHHSFRPAQVLLESRGVCLIDLDKVCMAEPASDIALFTSKLRHMAANKTVTAAAGENRRVEEIRRELLGAYGSEASVDPRRVALWEGLELVSLVLSAAKKLNADWVATCSAMLTRHLDDSGL
jgi:hypothetical protein